MQLFNSFLTYEADMNTTLKEKKLASRNKSITLFTLLTLLSPLILFTLLFKHFLEQTRPDIMPIHI